MTAMKDEEVGQKLHMLLIEPIDSCEALWAIALILKLVEERASWFQRLPHNNKLSMEDAIKWVCRDFHISPGDYAKAKEATK